MSMVNHKNKIVENLEDRIDPKKGDLVLDTGSSDGSLLKAYPQKGLTLVGVDRIIRNSQ